MRSIAAAVFVFSGLGLSLAGQQASTPPTTPQPKQPEYAQPESMPADRKRDSYEIYSLLLQSGPIEWRDVSRKQWLLEDTTTAEPLGAACLPPKREFSDMNPHRAVQAPTARMAAWKQVLTDFDKKCHHVLQLSREGFLTELPVHLLNADEQETFRAPSGGVTLGSVPHPEFADAAGLHRFSEVFFNEDHSLALVEQGMWCGGLCGDWTWVVLERRDGKWQELPWVTMRMMS